MRNRRFSSRGQSVPSDSGQERELLLVVRWPWWLHPAWALLLLTGVTMALTIALPAEAFEAAWNEPKFVDADAAGRLVLCLAVMFLGLIAGSGMAVRGGRAEIRFTSTQVDFLRRSYRVLMFLTIVGYIIWTASAMRQGAGIEALRAVVGRQEGAISALKSEAQPVSGVTTITQFGPVAAVLGYLLRKLGAGGRRYHFVIWLACLRGLFYAERLAVLEVAIPLLLLAALTVPETASRRVQRWTRLGPVMFAPLVWGIFAASEYTRSWVFYQQTTEMPFQEWVSLRLLGYYTTGFNNSALLEVAHRGTFAPPYFSLDVLWNAPLVSGLLGGADRHAWWIQVLSQHSNREFNNSGSFLVTTAEFGTLGALLFWLVVGTLIGLLFANLTKASVPALVAYVCVFVGILELPRLIYWTLGRSTPILLAVLFLALRYPRAQKASQQTPPEVVVDDFAGSNLLLR